MSKDPPMYRQYKKLKAAHPQALLFYRLGDFYELFEEDAEIGARELGLTLTQRRFSKEMRLPMAGMPHRYVNSYINRLLKKGYMVAVADQLEDSRKAKGLVKRGIVRVITAGTVMDQPMLKDHHDNFLLALAPQLERIGLAFVDLSTGDFNCTSLLQETLLEELTRIQPSEVILPLTLYQDESFCQNLSQLGVDRLSPLEPIAFDPKAAQAQLKSHFKVASLEAYGTDTPALIAAGAILHYLKTNHHAHLAHLTALSTYQLADYMALDTITRRNLELTATLREGSRAGSLLHLLDQTKTRMGTRLLRRWINHPLSNLAHIQARLDAVGLLVENAFLRQDLRTALHGMYDLERLAGRIGYGNANGRDLVNLKDTMTRVPLIKGLLQEAATPLLAELQSQLDPLVEMVTMIEQSLVDEPPILLTDGGLIKAGYHPQLESLRQTANTNRSWLTEYEAAERQRTGIKNLRLKFNQVFGFFIEVTKSNLNRVPKHYQRRATIANGERFITPELKEREAAILSAEEAANDLEYDLFLEVRRQVAEQLSALRRTAQALARLDVLLALATVAANHNYVKPQLTTEPLLELQAARHPVVESLLPAETPFVPNDCTLDNEQTLIVLTGPNMSGKSVYLRQVALTALMAHLGSFVAATTARIGLSDRIFARAGASDDISQGRSTFLVEMSETAHIIHHATPRSLVILDEVGRGTSTYDGLSLAWAVAEDIYHTIGARCLFATHFHELTNLGDSLPNARNYSLAVREQNGEVIFLRQLVPGGADRSYGIHVARLAGLPARILDQAETLLAALQERNNAPKSFDEARNGAPPQQHGDGPDAGGPNAHRLLPDEAEYDTTSQAETNSPLPPTRALAETPTTYQLDAQPVHQTLFLADDDPQVWQIVRELYRLDIANLTPIEALIRLNAWQQRLKQSR